MDDKDKRQDVPPSHPSHPDSVRRWNDELKMYVWQDRQAPAPLSRADGWQLVAKPLRDEIDDVVELCRKQMTGRVGPTQTATWCACASLSHCRHENPAAPTDPPPSPPPQSGDGEASDRVATHDQLKEEVRKLREMIEKLRDVVRQRTKLLDDQFGTPCEQIRHEQEVERLREEVLELRGMIEKLRGARSWGDYTRS